MDSRLVSFFPYMLFYLTLKLPTGTDSLAHQRSYPRVKGTISPLAETDCAEIRGRVCLPADWEVQSGVKVSFPSNKSQEYQGK